MDSTNLDSELFIEFKSRGKRCQLFYISDSHSEGLYEIVSTERERLAKWLPWVENMKSLENEKAFIKYAREKMERNELFMLTICVNQKPVGMAIYIILIYKNIKPKLDIGYQKNMKIKVL